MGSLVREQLKNRGIYLAFTGGCAALASSHMTLKGVFFEDLGMAEAIWVIDLDRLPLVVGIDAQGNDIFDRVMKHAMQEYERYRKC
jgi:fumarate hydratase subunit beta